MKILIDIGHPAHVHLFKNFAWQMQKKGHQIIFTARDKEHEIYLLKKYNLDYLSFGSHYQSVYKKLWGLFKFNILLLKAAIKFKPDIFLSHGSMYAAQISSMLRKPHISMEDTGNMEQIRLYAPFTNHILTPDILNKDLGNKQIRYKGYHELAYLRPEYFKPDEEVYNYLQIDRSHRYIVLRFVSWLATHDRGHSGLTDKIKNEAISKFSKFATVYISSEHQLPTNFEKFRLSIPPEKMHDVLYYADLLFSESATMASECAVLGTPAIYLDNTGRDYTRDQENIYNLVFNYTESLEDQELALNKGFELLKSSNTKVEWNRKKDRMLQDKIDPTALLVWFIENYPESFKIMKNDPDYQYNFC